jgi:mannose-1-phosphate guanylyltransferase/mannose-6-phosphate isomerase
LIHLVAYPKQVTQCPEASTTTVNCQHVAVTVWTNHPCLRAGGNIITSTDTIIPAIMVGGSGSRLQPLSSPEKPKQFLVFQGEYSLFQNTVKRIQADGFAAPWILANSKTYGFAEEQMAAIRVIPAGSLHEQTQIGTAAAIAALLVVLGQERRDELILVLPSDHIIARPDLFQHFVRAARPLARCRKIVIFGIVPTAPETGFGYIKPGINKIDLDSASAFSVQQPGGFVEKPNESDARIFLQEGYLWNAGIFLFTVETMLQEFETHAPQILQDATAAISSGSSSLHNGVFQHRLDDTKTSALAAAVPIDKAILEKSHNSVVVPCHALGWRDMGTLSAVQRLRNEQEKP